MGIIDEIRVNNISFNSGVTYSTSWCRGASRFNFTFDTVYETNLLHILGKEL